MNNIHPQDIREKRSILQRLESEMSFVISMGWSPNKKRKSKETLRKQKLKQSLHNQVRYKTRKAEKEGLMVRVPCEVCGEKKVEAHHPDYSDHMNVKWLCRLHHAQEHVKLYATGADSKIW